MAKWVLKKCRADIIKMSEDLNISPIFANVLSNRSIFSRNDALIYLNPQLNYMHDAHCMKDIDKAVNILAAAKENGRKVFIYGDYDVDGVMSTVILFKTLKSFGIDCSFYIPDREKEGYGLNKEAVQKIKDMGGSIIFTCDNGISALDEIMYIKELGMDIIVLDHHEPGFVDGSEGRIDVLPCADAVIDNKQKDCAYPFKMLCAGGMAYKFAEFFYKQNKMDFVHKNEFLIFAMIATICDIVDLKDENRIIVKNGLTLINSAINLNSGLEALIECCGIKGKTITEESIGFIIGPSINACGRLEKAMTAVKLFVSENKDDSFEYAKKLVEFNSNRKNITAEGTMKLIELVCNSDIKNDKVLLIHEPTVHESIIGIVAGKLKEYFYKPTIVFTDGNDCAKGSARSIEGYNIFESLYQERDLFQRFGGHSMAAGLSLEKENIDTLRKRLNEKFPLSDDQMTETIRIDRELLFEEITLNLANELDLMKPFGKDNKTGIFATKDVYIKRINFVGSNKNIMQIVFADQNGLMKRAVDFKGFDKLKELIIQNYSEQFWNDIFIGKKKILNLKLDIVYSIGINDYNNIKSVQLNLIDFRL